MREVVSEMLSHQYTTLTLTTLCKTQTHTRQDYRNWPKKKKRVLCGPRTFQTLIYESTVTVIQMNVARLQNFCDEGACFWDGPLSPLFKELRVWRVTSVIAALYPHSSCKDLRVWARNSFSHSSGNRGPLAYECEELGDSGPLFKSYQCEA